MARVPARIYTLPIIQLFAGINVRSRRAGPEVIEPALRSQPALEKANRPLGRGKYSQEARNLLPLIVGQH